MDTHSFFGASFSQPTDVMSSQGEDENDSSESDTKFLDPSPAKKTENMQEKQRSKCRPATSNRKHNEKWEVCFNWLIFDASFQGAFCKVCRKSKTSLQRTGGTWISP